VWCQKSSWVRPELVGPSSLGSTESQTPIGKRVGSGSLIATQKKNLTASTSSMLKSQNRMSTGWWLTAPRNWCMVHHSLGLIRRRPDRGVCGPPTWWLVGPRPDQDSIARPAITTIKSLGTGPRFFGLPSHKRLGTEKTTATRPKHVCGAKNPAGLDLSWSDPPPSARLKVELPSARGCWQRRGSLGTEPTTEDRSVGSCTRLATSRSSHKTLLRINIPAPGMTWGCMWGGSRSPAGAVIRPPKTPIVVPVRSRLCPLVA
jgi:hypothetical protein